jgi:ketosteroid isomerase-like protein
MKSLLPLAVLALSACATPSQHSAPAAQAQAAPSLADFSRWMDERYVAPFVAGDVPKWLTVFTEDAVALHNTMPPMKGKEAIAQFGTFVAGNLRIAEMKVTLSEVQVSGDLAYSWGTYHSRLLIKATGEPMPGHSENGKVLFVWKRQSDGTWKIAADMGNDLPNPEGRK